MLKWKGPFSVVSKFNENDYRVQVNDTVKSYHINMLKKYYEREPVKSLGIFDVVEPVDILEEVSNVKPIPECGVIAEQRFDDEKLLALPELKPVPLPSAQQKETIVDVHIDDQLSSKQKRDIFIILNDFVDILTDVSKKS